MIEEHDVFIAGAGLGGLLSSALLSQYGQKVFLIERLPFYGGRFTAHRYHGFEVPTGAVHMIPHSYRGPLGKILLKDLKLPLKIYDVENFTAWYWPNRKPIHHKSFWGIFKAFPRVKQRIFVLRKLLLDGHNSEHHLESFQQYLEERTDDPQIFQFFNTITGFALSLAISEISTAAMYRFLKRLYQRGRPGVPIGGCRAVVKALVNRININQVKIQNNSELIKLEMDGSTIESAVYRDIRTEEEFCVRAKHFILNLGYPQINKVFENSRFPYRLPSTPVAKGGGFVFRSKKSVLGSSAVSQFPELEFVKGAVEPSVISPNLTPQGEHLILAHQIFCSENIIRDVRFARNEFLETFPQLKEEDEVCIHTFQKNWPVNFAKQGNDLPNFSTEIPNLFFVGDGFKGNNGWFMTEGVAYGVKKVINKLIKKIK